MDIEFGRAPLPLPQLCLGSGLLSEGMTRNKRSASPERLKKKRKVVLVKAQAAQGQAEKPKGLARAKPEPIRGGTAGRELRGLLGARPEEKVPVEIKKATELRTASKPSPQPSGPERRSTVSITGMYRPIGKVTEHYGMMPVDACYMSSASKVL